MAYEVNFKFAPGEWFPYVDRDVLLKVQQEAAALQGRCCLGELGGDALEMVAAIRNAVIEDQ